MSKEKTTYMDYSLSLEPVDKDPFFETFDVFKNLDLKGKTLIKALDIIMQKANELYENVQQKTNIQKIPSFRYHEGTFERGELSEDKIFKQINKSISMLEYEHAIANLIMISNFYKKAYYRSTIYEPFFNYIKKVFDKFKEIEDLIENYEEKKFEIDKLIAENQFLQKQVSEERLKREEMHIHMEKFDTHFKNMFLNERILKWFSGAIDSKIIRRQTGYSIFQIVSRLLWQGRERKIILARSLGLSKKEFDDLINPYKELFVFIDDYVDLNFDIADVKRKKLILEYDEFLKKHGMDDIPDVDEEELKEEVLKDINKKDKKKEKPKNVIKMSEEVNDKEDFIEEKDESENDDEEEPFTDEELDEMTDEDVLNMEDELEENA